MAVAALVLNWAIISFTHLKFKRAMKLENKVAKFPALISPLSNYIVLIFIGMILYIMWTQGFEKSVILIPIWITFMFGLYKFLSWKKAL
ncbi:putative membrane protein [Acinetobacter pittii]|nr:putative membrane protein [Acinetobacter pittii]